MGGLMTDEDKYLFDKKDTNYMLKMGHAQTTLGHKGDTEELKQDLRANTVEGKERYGKRLRDVKFSVDNNLPGSHRLRIEHEFKIDEDKLIEKHRRHELTPITE